jgi:hypothetical protein
MLSQSVAIGRELNFKGGLVNHRDQFTINGEFHALEIGGRVANFQAKKALDIIAHPAIAKIAIQLKDQLLFLLRHGWKDSQGGKQQADQDWIEAMFHFVYLFFFFVSFISNG